MSKLYRTRQHPGGNFCMVIDDRLSDASKQMDRIFERVSRLKPEGQFITYNVTRGSSCYKGGRTVEGIGRESTNHYVCGTDCERKSIERALADARRKCHGDIFQISDWVITKGVEDTGQAWVQANAQFN